MKTLKQWELPRNSRVKLPDGKMATFLGMDGLYAKWDLNGEFKMGNYEKFIKKGDYYEVKINEQTTTTN